MAAFSRYIGIDHGFSFPLCCFEVHRLLPDWPTFLEDFQRHWRTLPVQSWKGMSEDVLDQLLADES